MRSRLLSTLALALLAALQLSCAVGGGGESAPAGVADQLPRSWPAKQGLPPAYRPLADELADYGDWILIEPYGWLFRPDVNFVAWRPYQDGYWQASDVYGWLWISNDPFGWITDHYGSWFYDRYQGWVWQPGSQWAPAWVAWVGAGEWVGWAPLAPVGYSSFGGIPGGVFTFAPAAQLALGDAPMHSSFVSDIGARVRDLRPLVAIGHIDGTAFNRGPDPAVIERAMGGALPRAIDATPRRLGRLEAELPAAGDERTLGERTRRAIEAGVRELDAFRTRGDAPPPPPPGPRRPQWRTPAPGGRLQPDASPRRPDVKPDSLGARQDSAAARPEAPRVRPDSTLAQPDSTRFSPPPRRKPGARPAKPRPATRDSTTLG